MLKIGVNDTMCAAKKGFLDEHILFEVVKKCAGVDPTTTLGVGLNGRPCAARVDDPSPPSCAASRPVHGYHVHSRRFDHPFDCAVFCSEALPFAQRMLRGFALERFMSAAKLAGCGVRNTSRGKCGQGGLDSSTMILKPVHSKPS